MRTMRVNFYQTFFDLCESLTNLYTKLAEELFDDDDGEGEEDDEDGKRTMLIIQEN